MNINRIDYGGQFSGPFVSVYRVLITVCLFCNHFWMYLAVSTVYMNLPKIWVVVDVVIRLPQSRAWLLHLLSFTPSYHQQACLTENTAEDIHACW